MSEEDRDEILDIAQAMRKYGGGFVNALAMLIVRADDKNLERIKKSFSDYWEQYKEIAEKIKKEGTLYD